MSVEPPSSGRRAGPPSGPLPGPSEPPTGPPARPPGGSGGGRDGSGGASGGAGGGGGTPPPGRSWWRSAPRLAVLATAAAAVVLAVVLTRSGGFGHRGGELFLQAAGTSGPEPFTQSTAAEDGSAPPVSASPATGSAPANVVGQVDGGSPGLYRGTRDVSSCDVEQQIKALGADPAKNAAFALVEGVAPTRVPRHLRALTPVRLRMDTRVTNHGYRNGAATSYQAVLQAGTAVLVDGRGVPRVRCACGNPLAPPVALRTAPAPTGDTWPGYSSSNVVVVGPAPRIIDVFVLYDPERGEWIARHRGDIGHHDRSTTPPANPSPSVGVSAPTAPSSSSSPSGCASAPGPDNGPTPCPPTSTAPSGSPSAPSSQPASSEPATSPPDTPATSAAPPAS